MAAIQPCALLLLVGDDWRVETVSANIAMIGDHRAAEVVGQPVADLLGSEVLHDLRNRLSWLASDESAVHDFGTRWGDVGLDVRATRADDQYLLEAELAVEARLPDAIGMVRSLSDRLSGDDPVMLATQAMRQLSALTGFDDVMLVDRSDTPIASVSRDRSKSTNIKGKGIAARRSAIADRDADPVPLIGNDGQALIGQAIYIAPEHDELEALEARGAVSSLTLPLRIDGERVASVHAFHTAPRRVGAERRSVAHLFAERLVARMARHGWEA